MTTGKYFLFVSFLVLATFVVGCDSSTPTGLENWTRPDTAEEAVERFRLALAERDSQGIKEALSEDFRLHAGRNSHILGVEYLDGERFLLAMARMCGPAEELEPCHLDSVDIFFWSNWDWVPVTNDPRFPDTFLKRYNVEMKFFFPSCTDYMVYGTLDFFAREDTSEPTGPGPGPFEIVGVADYTWDNKNAVASDAFSQVIDLFLFEGLPHAILSEEEIRGTDLGTFILDAGDSWCSGEGLPDQPFRWNVDGSDQWSDWGAAVHGGFQFDEPGEHSVVLEVRNKVGWTSRATTEFGIVSAYPATVNQLLSTFSYAHEERDLLALINCLDQDFAFNFQPQDVDAYELPSDQFNMAEYYATASNLFDEMPGPGRPDPAVVINFWTDYASGAPVDTVSVAHSVIRNPAESLFARGSFSFVANQVSVVLPGDGAVDVWKFSEISDLTNTDGFSGGNITWGGILATYR